MRNDTSTAENQCAKQCISPTEPSRGSRRQVKISKKALFTVTKKDSSESPNSSSESPNSSQGTVPQRTARTGSRSTHLSQLLRGFRVPHMGANALEHTHLSRKPMRSPFPSNSLSARSTHERMQCSQELRNMRHKKKLKGSWA